MSEQDTWEKDNRTWALVRLLIECRDALPALSVTQVRLHRISPTICTRIDEALKLWESDSLEAI